MGNLWERFDNIANTDEIQEAKAQLKPLPAGTYEMKLVSIKASESAKSKLPMMKVECELVDGGRRVYYNQVLQNLNYEWITTKNIATILAFIEGITGEEVLYKGLGNLADLVAKIETDEVFDIRVSYGKKDIEESFPTFTVIPRTPIEEIFSPEGDDTFEVL